MGSYVELNDTLQITTEQGFPSKELDLEKHKRNPIKLEDVKDKIFEFHDKSGARVFHPAPNRCFLVHNIDGKWLYWGKIIMLEQTIKGEKKESQKTSGKYKIIQIYDPEYQEQMAKLTQAAVTNSLKTLQKMTQVSQRMTKLDEKGWETLINTSIDDLMRSYLQFNSDLVDLLQKLSSKTTEILDRSLPEQEKKASVTT